MSLAVEEMLLKRRTGTAVMGAAVGSGYIGHCLSQSGIDFLAVYSGSIMHMRSNDALAGLLPLIDANEVSFTVGREVAGSSPRTPVYIGLAAWDPVRSIKQLLHRVGETDFAGIINFPTVGFYDGVMRAYVERTGFSFEREAELIERASEAGLSTAAFAFTPAEAAMMARAGAQIIIASTPSGDTTADAITAVENMCEAVTQTGFSPILLCQGGPLSEPAQVQSALSQVPALDGFFGARALVAAPIHEALTNRLNEFRYLRPGGKCESATTSREDA